MANLNEQVIYVDNEGVEYPARILWLGENETAELLVTGEPRDWTVINVPHAARLPKSEAPGAYWKYETYPEIPAPRVDEPKEQPAAPAPKKAKAPPKRKKD